MTAARSDPVHSSPAFVLPLARGRAAMRGVMWCAGATAIGLVAAMVLSRLDFTKTGVHSRLVEGSLAMLIMPPALGAIACALQGLRGLVLAFWPGQVGLEANDHRLTLRLGPLGTLNYPVAELDIKYLFEWSAEEESFEAFLPEETQRATMLPRILHPPAKEQIQQKILRFAAGTESEIAEQMRPWIERVRGEV